MNAYSCSLALALVLAATSGVGCAAATTEGEDVETDLADLSTAGAALIGSYEGGATFQSLELTKTKAGSANVFTAEIDTGVRCVAAPCPQARLHMEGTFTAGATTITFKTSTLGPVAAKAAGRYRYEVDGATLRLTRGGSTDTLEKFDATPGPLTTCASGAFTQAFADGIAATVAPVSPNTDSFQAPRFKRKIASYSGRTWTRGADGRWSSSVRYLEGYWGDLYLGDAKRDGTFEVVLHAKTSRYVSVSSSMGELRRYVYFEGPFAARPGTADVAGPVVLAGGLSESPWGSFGSAPAPITFRGQVRLTDHCFSMLDAPVTASTTEVREVFSSY